MEELLKKALEWIERYWHKKPIAFIAPIATSVILFWYLYSAQSGKISTINLVLVIAAGLIVLVAWILTNRLPRVKKGNAGIVIGILCDGPDEDKQVKVDFIANLRLLMQQPDAFSRQAKLARELIGKCEFNISKESNTTPSD